MTIEQKIAAEVERFPQQTTVTLHKEDVLRLLAVADAADKYIKQQVAGLPSNRLLHAYYDARGAE